MKSRYIAIILGIIIIISVIFAMAIQPESPLVRKGILPFPQEEYHIEITGLKDVYLVGEPYSFGYTISGYGYPCGDIQVVYPDMSGDSTFENSYKDCGSQSMHKFTNRAQDNTGDTLFHHDGLMNPGLFTIGVAYEHGGGIEPAQGGKQFHVVEKICNTGSEKKNAECLAESYQSCESAYMTQQFSIENGVGGTVSLKATVDSWHDCQLTVYTENSLDGHTPFNGIRSICKDVTVNESSLNFENCTNADYPSIMFSLQDDSDSEPFSLTFSSSLIEELLIQNQLENLLVSKIRTF